mgnify:CR=1 FL=1
MTPEEQAAKDDFMRMGREARMKMDERNMNLKEKLLDRDMARAAIQEKMINPDTSLRGTNISGGSGLDIEGKTSPKFNKPKLAKGGKVNPDTMRLALVMKKKAK